MKIRCLILSLACLGGCQRDPSPSQGMARVYTLAGYIRYAMPFTNPGSLTDEEAQQLAAYIDAQERPPFNVSDDYPNGETPVDAVYYTKLYPSNPLASRL